MKLLELDQKRADSLSAFYAAQKGYFQLIEDMEKTEVEIQQLLSVINKGGKENHDEMQASKERFIWLEENRVQMMEGWLEWLEELS